MPARSKSSFSSTDLSKLADIIAICEINFTTGSAHWSPACEELYGVGVGGLGHDMERWSQLLNPQDLMRVHWEIEQACKSHQRHFRSEVRLKTKDGQSRWIIIDGVVVEGGRRRDCRIVAQHFDITVRKRADEEKERALLRAEALRRDIQRQYEESQKANRLKDAFLATVAHELRTPLSVITGWLELMRKNELNDQEFSEAMVVLSRNAKIQNKLIDDLLDAAQMARSKLAVHAHPMSLTKAIDEAMATVRFAADTKDILIGLDNSQIDGEVWILGDGLRIQQVLWNILSNAIKYTPPGGEVRIVSHMASGQVEIAVHDTGAGIDPEFLPWVFDSFLQEGSPNVQRPDGLGLGLSIAQHIVSLHGGTLTAESPGRGLGATFRLRFPILNEKDKALHDATWFKQLPDAPKTSANSIV